MNRESSPPLAMRVSEAKGAPGLVETSNSTRSRPRPLHCASAKRLDSGAEAGGVELERRQLAGDGGVEPVGSCLTHLTKVFGCFLISSAALVDRAFQRRQPLFARFERRQPRRKIGRQRGQGIGFDAMLAGERTDLEQPRLGRLQPRRIAGQGLGGGFERVLGLGRLDQCAVERCQRGLQFLMLAADPLHPPHRLTQQSKAALRTVEQLADRGNVLGKARALLHVRAQGGERFLLASLGRELRQLGDGMVEPLAVA